MELDKTDVENLKQLKFVFNSGSFDLKGDSIVHVGKLVLWLDKLEEKINDELKAKLMRSIPKTKKLRDKK